MGDRIRLDIRTYDPDLIPSAARLVWHPLARSSWKGRTMQKSQMTPHQQRVAEFMAKAGQDVPTAPTVPAAETRILRAKLILEEAFETIRALGVCVWHRAAPEHGWANVTHIGELNFTDLGVEQVDIVEVVDGCADVSVVTNGTLLAFGVADKPILEAVDASNLAKFGPGGYRREDGKWVKSKDWVPPDIAGLLADQCTAAEEPA